MLSERLLHKFAGFRRSDMYTENSGAWWELEHEFSGFVSTAIGNSLGDGTEVGSLLEALYEPILEYVRGLDQEDFIALVKETKPDLLKMVEEV
jgi:hypothetical protein